MRPERIDVTECQGEVKRAKCFALKQNINRSIKRAKMYINDYDNYWYQCNTLLEQYRNGFRCAACDTHNNIWLDIGRKKIIIKRTNIDEIVKKCYNMDLFELKVLREVYMAFLNYAKQVKPDLPLDHTILYDIFSDRIESCAQWIKFTGATKKMDTTKSRECLMYGYEKLNSLLIRPNEVRFNYDLTVYFKVVVNILAETSR